LDKFGSSNSGTIDIESFLASRSALAPATLEKIFAVLSSALGKEHAGPAECRLVCVESPAGASRPPWGREQLLDSREAATFLRVARHAGPQPAAFYALALDSGMRKSELADCAGPTWIYPWSRGGATAAAEGRPGADIYRARR
jgi:hypothetical protein